MQKRFEIGQVVNINLGKRQRMGGGGEGWGVNERPLPVKEISG